MKLPYTRKFKLLRCQIIITFFFILIDYYFKLGDISSITFQIYGNTLFWLSVFNISGFFLIVYKFISFYRFQIQDNIVNHIRSRSTESQIRKIQLKNKITDLIKSFRFLRKFMTIYNDKVYKCENIFDQKIKDLVEEYKDSKKLMSNSNKGKKLKRLKTSIPRNSMALH